MMRLCLFCSFVTILQTSCTEEKQQVPTRASIEISSIPDGAELYYKGKKIGQSPYKQESVKPGFKLIRLEKEGYESRWLQFSAKAGEAVNIEERLDPVKASIMITSNPTRSSVVIDGDIKGETPLVIHHLPFGEYKAEINAHGYSSKTVSWTVNNSRPQRVNIDLDSNTGFIEVISDPEGARVYIDNKAFGVTPVREEVEEGKHSIRIEKVGYEPYEQNVSIARGSEKRVGSNLKIKPSSINVTTKPTGAEVFINGEAYSSSPTVIENLKPGDYVIMVRKDAYDDEVREMTIAPGQQATVSITMGTNLGGIDTYVNPPGVTIYLDRKKVGYSIADAGGNSKVLQLRGLTSGTHNLRFSHKRATPQNISMNVVVRKGEITRTKKIKMWIADTVMTMTNGRVLRGRLILQNDQEVIFSVDPKITQGYKPSEIKSLEPLEFEE